MALLNQLIFFGALLLFASIVASSAAARFGVPLLLVFLAFGMLAGEDGPGGFVFDDYATAYLVSTLALAVILFDGGMRTPIRSFRVGLGPALSLATLGVILTAAITGFFAVRVLEMSWLEGLLLGAIVGSTDAAAVFSLLQSKGLRLKERVAATLEIESGINDPMAVFLTIALVELIGGGHESLSWSLVPDFVWQMALGTATGLAGGWALAGIINRLPLALGMYPLLALSGGLLVYGVTTVAQGSGYLAIYLAGLVLGNRPLHARQNILRVHDGMAWLSQIVMFVLLGLLAKPVEMLQIAPAALVITFVLNLIARPLAVGLSLVPFPLPWREQVFIAWVGLRGAVPIILATFPLLAGLEDAQIYFNVAFFVVVASLILQGWSIAPVARWLGLQMPPVFRPLQRIDLDVPAASDHDLFVYRLGERCPVAGTPIDALRLPPEARLVGVIRNNVFIKENPGTLFEKGDHVYLFAPHRALEQLNRLFADQVVPPDLTELQFFGEFILDGRARLGELADIYGLNVPEELKSTTLAEHLAQHTHNRPVVGDRVRLANVELVVREIELGRVTQVGLVLHGRKSDELSRKK